MPPSLMISRSIGGPGVGRDSWPVGHSRGIDIKYDVGACQARCRQRAAAEQHFQKKADACEDCIKGHSCMGATFDCGGRCLGVVP